MRVIVRCLPFVLAAFAHSASAGANEQQPSLAPLPEVAAHMSVVAAAREAAQRNAGSPDERALIQADLDFAADALRRHVSEAFAERLTSDAILIGPGDPVAVGKDAVREAMSASKAEWHWAPVAARASGDLGVTWGVAAILYKNTEGRQASLQTRYVTVWQRRDGRWQIWLDTGNSGPASAEMVDLASGDAGSR